MGLKAFKKAQYAVEAVHGDGTTPTKHMIGSLLWNPEITWHEPDEDTGLLSRYTRRTKLDERTILRYEGSATYDQLADWLLASVKGGVAAVGNLYTFSPNLTAVNDPDTLSIIAGDDVEQYAIAYVVVTSLEISLAMGEVAMIRADMVGRPMAASTFEVIALPAPEDVVAHQASIWIDDTWAALGTAAKTGLLIGATLRFPTGLVPVKYADGTAYFSGFAENKRNLDVDLTYLHTATAVTEWGKMSPGTKRFIRIKIIGTGTKYLQLDFCGTYQGWPTWGERDGENVIATKLMSEYDATSTKEFEVLVSTA